MGNVQTFGEVPMEQITERKQFKKANGKPVSDSNELSRGNAGEWLSLALESANMSAYKWDLQTDIITKSNQSAMDSVVSPASNSFKYQDAFEYIYPEDRDFFAQKIQEAVDTGQNFNIEYRVS